MNRVVQLAPFFCAPFLCFTLLSCAVGTGEGEVTSEALFVEGCADGPLDLMPDFFASNPHLDTQLIVLKRGDRLQEISDGVLIAVHQVSRIREELLGQPIEVGLPPGLNPPGHVISGDLDPPFIHMTLFLNDSCHEQDVSLQAVSGTITFSSLFTGDVSDRKRELRLIEGSFEVQIADPRLLPADGSEPTADLLSPLVGSFRFYFRRGPTAQPFP